MITVYQLKTSFQNILRPVCNSLAERGVTANQVTLAALITSLLYAGLLGTGVKIFWLLLPVFLFIRMGLNAIDGMLAREHNMKSRLGAALNELGDVVSDTALFLPFILYAPASIIVILLFIFTAIMTEMCGLVAYMMSGVRRYDGPMGKSDRAFVTGTLGLLIGLGFSLQGLVFWVFLVLVALSLWTCVNRIKSALKEG